MSMFSLKKFKNNDIFYRAVKNIDIFFYRKDVKNIEIFYITLKILDPSCKDFKKNR